MSVAIRAGRTVGLLLVTSAGVHAVTHGMASAVRRRQHLALAVVVIVVPAFVAVTVPAVAMMLAVFRQLPHILFPLHPSLFVLVHAVDQTAGKEGDGHEEDNHGAHN